jgi:DNA-binding transcriptional regulator LsrR (DeoR family)/DNA-binding XRE family transcriptional regulator
MDDPLKALGSNLRQARLQHGLSQSELGYRIGIGYSSISLWESGARAPSLMYLYRLCKTLGSSADELLNIRVAPHREEGRGIEWISSRPDSRSTHFKANILDGIDLFALIVCDGLNLSRIHELEDRFRYMDHASISSRINAALLSGSISFVDVERDQNREHHLAREYNLEQCVVAKLDKLPKDGDIDEPIRAEAAAFLAAKHCLPFMREAGSIGFSGGSPNARFFDLLPPFSPDLAGIEWSPLLTSIRFPRMAPLSNTANGILSGLFYTQLNTMGYEMPFVNIERRSDEYFARSSGSERAELEHARFVQRAASQVNTAFLSVGSPQSDYGFFETGFAFAEFTKAFHGLADADRRSCVGDIMLTFVDKGGNRIGSKEDQLHNDSIVYSIKLEDLKEMVRSSKLVWLLGASPKKAEIIKALLVSGMANSLVIDSDTADAL